MGITKPVGRPSCGDMYEKLPTRPLVVQTSVRSIRVTGRGAIVVGSGLIRAGLLALAASVIGTPTIHAAEIRVVGTRDDSVVIAIVGEILSGDDQRFETVAGNAAHALVTLSSPGGNLFAGLVIGAMIHDRGYSTFVGPGNQCASVCGSIWLGGTRRFLTPSSKLGFHAAFNSRTGQETGEGNAILGAYLSQLGLTYAAIAYVTKAGPADATWLSAADANELGIEYQVIDAPNPELSREFGRTGLAPSSTAAVPPALPPATAPPPSPRGRVVPAESAPIASPLGRDLVSRFAERWLGQVPIAVFNSPRMDHEMLLVLYDGSAPTIRYYGEDKTIEEVIADKLAFAKRWPERSYVIRRGSVVVEPQAEIAAGNNVIKATGIVDFVANSPKQRSAGSARFVFLLRAGTTNGSEIADFRIVSESSELLTRKMTKNEPVAVQQRSIPTLEEIGAIHYRQSEGEIIELTGLYNEPECRLEALVDGKVIKRQFADNGVVVTGFVLENTDGTREFVNVQISEDLSMAARRIVIPGLQRLVREGRNVHGRVHVCGSGRLEFLKEIK